MGFEQLHERGLFCIKNAGFFPVYLQPVQQVIFLRGLGLSPKVLAYVVVTKWNFQNLVQDHGYHVFGGMFELSWFCLDLHTM